MNSEHYDSQKQKQKQKVVYQTSPFAMLKAFCLVLVTAEAELGVNPRKTTKFIGPSLLTNSKISSLFSKIQYTST